MLIFADVMKHSRPHLEQILSVMNQALEQDISEQEDPPLPEAARAARGERSPSCAAKCPGRVASTRDQHVSLPKRQPVLRSWWLSAGESDGAGLKSEVLLVLKP